MFALAVLSYALDRSRNARPSGASAAPEAPADARAAGARAGALRRDPVALAFAGIALALGALLFAGSLAAGGEDAWPGLVAGAALAGLAAVAVSRLLDRVRRRLDDSAAALLPAWADAAALLLAGVAILFPPAALLGVAALAYLLVAGRRAGDTKYEGLRVLR